MAAILDSTGTPIPRVNPRRDAIVRRINARYDAAQTSRHNENHWQWADGLSAGAANSPDVRRTLRNRARYEFGSNSYAHGILWTLATDTIGTGPALQMLSGDDQADTTVERSFWKWTLAARLAEKLRTMRVAKCRDGETFGLLFTNLGLRHPVKLDLREYEADQVARPWIMLEDPMMSDGIIYDDFGNPLAYTVLRRHPGDTGTISVSGEYDMIPSRDMIHLFRKDRPGQVRGLSEITPALPLFAELRDYSLSVMGAARTAADLAAVLQTQQSPEDPDDIEPLDVFDLERRSIMTLPRGWIAQQMKSEQPATTFEMWERVKLREILRCISIPWNIGAGDSSSYNYASGRLDHKTYFKTIRVERSYIEITALEPLFERWWEEARLVDGVLPQELRALREPPLHEWRWDGDEHVDPLKEANAQAILLKSRTTSLAREYSRKGLDWEDELRQIAKEQQFMRELGLTLEEQPTPPDDEEEADDGEE